MKHVHRFVVRWLIPMSPADYQGWTRVVMHGVCPCGASWILAAEENTQRQQQRLLEEGA